MYSVGGYVNWFSHYGKQYGGSPKLKELSHDTPTDSWMHIWKKYEITNSKWYMHPIFIAALFTIASMWKQPRCASDVWIKISLYIHNFLLLSCKKKKKNGIQPFAETWINLEDIILSEISQRKRHTIYHLHVESKKNKLMYIAKQKQTLHR